MRFSLSILALAASLTLSACTGQRQTAEAGWELVWADEFEIDGLPDSTKWGYAVGGHGKSLPPPGALTAALQDFRGAAMLT